MFHIENSIKPIFTHTITIAGSSDKADDDNSSSIEFNLVFFNVDKAGSVSNDHCFMKYIIYYLRIIGLIWAPLKWLRMCACISAAVLKTFEQRGCLHGKWWVGRGVGRMVCMRRTCCCRSRESMKSRSHCLHCSVRPCRCVCL